MGRCKVRFNPPHLACCLHMSFVQVFMFDAPYNQGPQFVGWWDKAHPFTQEFPGGDKSGYTVGPDGVFQVPAGWRTGVEDPGAGFFLFMVVPSSFNGWDIFCEPCMTTPPAQYAGAAVAVQIFQRTATGAVPVPLVPEAGTGGAGGDVTPAASPAASPDASASVLPSPEVVTSLSSGSASASASPSLSQADAMLLSTRDGTPTVASTADMRAAGSASGASLLRWTAAIALTAVAAVVFM